MFWAVREPSRRGKARNLTWSPTARQCTWAVHPRKRRMTPMDRPGCSGGGGVLEDRKEARHQDEGQLRVVVIRECLKSQMLRSKLNRLKQE